MLKTGKIPGIFGRQYLRNFENGIIRADGLDAYLWSARHSAVEGPYVTWETDT